MLVKKIYVYAEETEYNNLKQWFDLIEIVRVDKETLSNIEMRSLLIIFCKGLNLDFFNEVEKSISKSKKYIFIWNVFNYIFVSKIRCKSEKGCINCLFNRWITTKKDSKELLSLSKVKNASSMYEIPTICYLHITKFILECINTNTTKTLVIEKNKMNISRKEVLPVPTCKYCGNLKKDSIENAYKDIKLLKDSKQKKFRKYSLKELLPDLLEMYVDEEVGIINFLLDDIEAPFAVSVANLPSLLGKDEVGVGRTSDYSISRAVAILEALERYCGLEPRGKTAFIERSYNELDHSIAINPVKLGLHTEEQYDDKYCAFEKFNPDEKMKWVYGISATDFSIKLVPEKIAYYGLRLRDQEYHNFVYEISNGCAVGGTLKEASLSGLMEVIERDAFLNTWYNEIPLYEIDFDEITDNKVHLMKNQFEYLFPYELHVFDMRIDIDIPIVLLVAKKKDTDAKNIMNIMCAAGISLSWAGAITNALHELCDIYPALNKKFMQRIAELEKMSNNFSLVKTMEDHSLLYGLPSMEKYFSFLLCQNNKKRKVEPTMFHGINSLNEIFGMLTENLKSKGLETIIINQTSEELEKSYLYCVKVLVPGMLPMTFGHINRRVENLDRIHEIGQQYGRGKYRIVPHPFP